MTKNLVITSICVGLGFIAIGFQNCGSQAEFSNGEILSKNSLTNLIDNDQTIVASEDEKREVLIEMDLVMNQDPRTVEEPLEDVMEADDESGKVHLRKECETYLCKKKNDKSNGQKKYMLCHVPAGDYAKAKTLCLPKPALKAHLKHLKNDNPTSYMGPCK